MLAGATSRTQLDPAPRWRGRARRSARPARPPRSPLGRRRLREVGADARPGGRRCLRANRSGSLPISIPARSEPSSRVRHRGLLRGGRRFVVAEVDGQQHPPAGLPRERREPAQGPLRRSPCFAHRRPAPRPPATHAACSSAEMPAEAHHPGPQRAQQRRQVAPRAADPATPAGCAPRRRARGSRRAPRAPPAAPRRSRSPASPAAGQARPRTPQRRVHRRDRPRADRRDGRAPSSAWAPSARRSAAVGGPGGGDHPRDHHRQRKRESDRHCEPPQRVGGEPAQRASRGAGVTRGRDVWEVDHSNRAPEDTRRGSTRGQEISEGWRPVRVSPSGAGWVHQTTCTARVRPIAEAIRHRSCGSLVTTRSSRDSALTTTAASTRSRPSATARASPAERACSSVNGSMRQPCNSRDNCACGPPRQTWPSTTVGSVGRSSRASRRRCSAHTEEELRSAAIRAPASYVTPFTPRGAGHACGRSTLRRAPHRLRPTPPGRAVPVRLPTPRLPPGRP